MFIDRLINNTSNSPDISKAEAMKQIAPDKSNAESLIKSLTPGQTFQGEVLNADENKALIKLVNDMVIDAKIASNVAIEAGKLMTFQVKNNGRSLSLTPLFVNTSNDATIMKALDMAGIEPDESALRMVEEMMNKGMSIDKKSLLSTYKEVINNRNVPPENVVDLKSLGLYVNEDNLKSLEAFKNLTHKINMGNNEISNGIVNEIAESLSNGNTGEAAALFKDMSLFIASNTGGGVNVPVDVNNLKEVLGFINDKIAGSGETVMAAGEGSVGDIKAQINNLYSELKSLIGDGEFNETAGKAFGSSENTTEGFGGNDGNSLNGNALNGNGLKDNTFAHDVLRDNNSDSVLNNMADNAKNSAGNKALYEKTLDTVNKAIDLFLKTNDSEAVRDILSNKDVLKVFKELLMDERSIPAEDVKDKENIKKFYEDITKQLKDISDILTKNNRTDSPVFTAVENMSRNLDFLNQINHMFSYVQLPLKMNDSYSEGELYVFTDKKSLAAFDGRLSALLHLDMEHLGNVDVYVTLENEKVSTNFYLADDSTLDLINDHIGILNERLANKGYDLSVDLSVKDITESDNSGIKPVLNSIEKSVPIQMRAFDVRT
ncbi:MAG: flagellar hook-length control protein FliK [Lachnospiraceae bacterium]|nr:flagellar hook-length control protein FliK [Lachnospiraceae bacterium]